MVSAGRRRQEAGRRKQAAGKTRIRTDGIDRIYMMNKM
jgi:hypothetical protein